MVNRIFYMKVLKKQNFFVIARRTKSDKAIPVTVLEIASPFGLAMTD